VIVTKTGVLIVGAGPIGLEVHWELKRRGIDCVHLDKSQVASTIEWFPNGMTFFSSPDRIGICGIPLQTPGQRKATKDEYLDYIRTVVMTRDLAVRTFEEVVSLEPGFVAHTKRNDGEHRIEAEKVVLATGDMAQARLLGIPGEDLPHVSHYFREPHRHFQRQVLVVGGKNSAVEAALRCWHAGAQVSLAYRGDAFPEKSVKYWLLPELKGRIHRGEIQALFRTDPLRISPTHVTLRRDGVEFDVGADDVLLMTGYTADMSLFEQLGAELEGEDRSPVIDPDTMETTVPGLYVAGTATAGTQHGYTLFLENCHIHAVRIAAALAGDTPPPEPPPLTVPES